MFKHTLAWLAVILAIAGVGGGLSLYKINQFKAAGAGHGSHEPMEAVAAVRARTGEVAFTTRAIGTVVALRQLDIRNEIAGLIAEMGFSSGSIVEAGQLLVQLDVRQEQAALVAAEAEAQLAKQNLDRREGLRSSPAYSAQETDRSRSEHASASARARSLAVAIEKKRIVAPFRARIGITNLQPGAYLESGTLIGRLQGIEDDVHVDFSLPQDEAAEIRTGTSVVLSGSAIPAGTTAVVVAEDDSINSTNRAVRLRATAKGIGGLVRPGTFVDVIATTSKPRATVLIPLTALRRSPNGQHVFVLVEEAGKLRARQRTVTTGAIQGDDIAVDKGLVAGELIAASGSFKLREGLLVNTEVPRAANATTGVN